MQNSWRYQFRSTNLNDVNKPKNAHFVVEFSFQLISKSKKRFQKLIQDCSYQGEALKFRLPFNVYGAVVT